ncbi:wax ester/triacylglycerol synthase family O-acyltransferase [Planosporangium sp. 12N6]|uniref:wax ester/triacylglycerol synthase family O-acyltransferase n=1 Tax=Planosporangium spinosum TaxID=3402278 RepID=UPI003CF90B3D
MDRDRLSALDTAFLCLESPRAPMHLGALAVFQSPRRIPSARLRTILGDRIARLPHLRQRVRPTLLPPGAAVWEEDRSFDLSRHLHLHQLPRGGRSTLATLAAELMAEPLDLRHPLWQLHVVRGLGGGRFAVLVKLHHAMADGLRAVELSVGLLDGYGDARPAPAATRADRTAAGPWPLWGAVRTTVAAARRPDRLLAGLARTALGLPHAIAQTAGTVGIASSIVASARLGALLSPMLDAAPGGLGPGGGSANGRAAAPAIPDHTAVRSTTEDVTSTDRRLALLRLDVGTVRQVRRRYGGTDNDVLLAVVAGALRDWLADQGHQADSLNVRAFIPVSRRSRPDGPRRGNVLSGYLCDLPVREGDAPARLRQIRAAMDRHKAAGFASGPGALPVLADRLPAVLHRVAGPLARHGAPLLFDTMITNVPIPSRPFTLAGAYLQEVYPIAPLARGQALGIALSAYQGRVHVGLHADRQALPDLHRLADAVPAALAGLTGAV